VADRPQPGRRALLVSLPGLVLGCDTSRPRAGALGVAERFNLRVQRGLFSSARLSPTPPDGATTPIDAFPAYFVSPSVPLAPPMWVLRVRGLVDRPMDLSLPDLERMTRTDVRVRHHCVEGWSAVASWHGVRVAELARAVGARSEAGFVEFRSFDSGYYSSWDRESAEHAQSILAYGMNGTPLTPAHGAPLRLYGAVKLGYKSVKYLEEIRFLPAASGGFWEDRGYEWFAGV
jgi:DMSO/TMAO reductase YedYZ molybdopterin-dependent catalytic subunit